MRKNLDDDDDDDEDDFYSSMDLNRSRRIRPAMTRIQRRTALSLRPISQKCYADPHSPKINSDSEDLDVDGITVRRSARNKRSWITADQMHRGYPNLLGYSEDDSRDASEVTRRVTRTSSGRRRQPNPKYLFDYDEKEDTSSRQRKKEQNEQTNRRESNDKENDEGVNGAFKEESAESTQTSSKKNEGNGVNEKIMNNEKDDTFKQSSNSDLEEGGQNRRNRSRIQRRTRAIRENYNTRKINRNMMDSSSEEEEEARKYSLRVRAPKQPPATVFPMRNIKRRYKRPRLSSSSSDSSSSTDNRHKKGKPPKSPHSKNEKMKSGGDGVVLPIRPEILDQNIRFNTIGGLDHHVQCLKEMILLPMMYPEVYERFQIQPPRGVLFHGPPGTGKTLIARALANECSFGSRKVTFFMRKGADLLSKWIGESEKQLRMLFTQAGEMKPSIIFFDELDGLAPVRSSGPNQVHASIVSTLLALLDGLDNRGEVIVIGATNRIDSIDPALRRPGRFDRELFFPLPSRKEREEILRVHVSQWAQPPTDELLGYLAENSVGYCGSDLRALCTEAVILGFRRTYPQVYNSDHRLLINPENVTIDKVDFMRAKSLLVPSSQRICQGIGRKLLPILDPILKEPMDTVVQSLKQTFPHGFDISLAKVKLSPNVGPARLILTGDGIGHGQTSHLAPALLFQMEHIHAYLLDLSTLFKETGRSAEEACVQVFNEARRNVPSIVYIPSIDKWWELVPEPAKAILQIQLSQLDPNVPILFFATSEVESDNLPNEIQQLFSEYREEIFEIKTPEAVTRRNFFAPLILEISMKPVMCEREQPKVPSPLPRAPTPPPVPMTETQASKLFETEEHTLRELRIFLRDICRKLANNKSFFIFTKPVDTSEVPDYKTIIEQPMDLETMMAKVDLHRYECAKDFLTDIELICRNALEYNPARTSADKQIRHRACSLRDYAYTLIKNEMDTDFEDKCRTIASSRRERNQCVNKYLPPYMFTHNDVAAALDKEQKLINESLQQADGDGDGDANNESAIASAGEKKEVEGVEVKPRSSLPKKRKCTWQKGKLLKRTKRVKLVTADAMIEEDANTKEVENSEISSKTSGDAEEGAMAPLTINCDMKAATPTTTPLQSPMRKLVDLKSPSQLLDQNMDFDDVDRALNEKEQLQVSSQKIECDLEELRGVLNDTVEATEKYPLNYLLDLYNRLNRIIKRFGKMHNRKLLPLELSNEVARFRSSHEILDVTDQ